MITNAVKCGSTICLGHCGENCARKIVFDISDFIESFGESGTVQLIAQRPREAVPYPCVITRKGDKVSWVVTSADVEIPSDYMNLGKCELRYILDDIVVKSHVFDTCVIESLVQEGSDPPEPQKAWVDQVLQAGTDAQNAAERAELAATRQPIPNAETGTWWVWNGETGEYEDSGEKYQGEAAEIDEAELTAMLAEVLV